MSIVGVKGLIVIAVVVVIVLS